MVKDLSVRLCGVELRNPVIPASGTFGFGTELEGAFDLNLLGGISLKGTTEKARYGNREYARCCARADACGGIDIIEVNISCPNVHDGGMAFGTSARAAAEVTAAVKEVTRKPVFVKLSPNVTDIVEIAKACEGAGADGLTLVNTFLGMRIDIQRRRPVIAAGMGGFSGRAVFPIALRMVWQVAHACRIPVMGCGGVASAEDVVEMMMAGAAAVQVGAENIRNPWACPEIVEALPGLLDRLGAASARELIGAV